jgi:hypothetical protein
LRLSDPEADALLQATRDGGQTLERGDQFWLNRHLLETAVQQATDILMDRVWQLENETFRDTPGFVFAPMTDVVDLSEDATAMNPEVQRQA